MKILGNILWLIFGGLSIAIDENLRKHTLADIRWTEHCHRILHRIISAHDYHCRHSVRHCQPAAGHSCIVAIRLAYR